VQAGAGIVADSVPESEYEETEQKMGGVLAALEAIESDSGSDSDSGVDADDAPAEQEVSR
jgi:anthranilate synthase component 1